VAGSIKITIKKNNLDFASKEVREAMSTAMQKFQFDFEAQALSAVPVDTGTLKNSYSSEVTDTSFRGHFAAPYAAFVEWGTRFMAAQPYAEPAVRAVEPGLQAAIDDIAARLGG